MATATMTSKGQMTLPKEIRDDLHLAAGDQIDIVKENGRYVLRPRNVRVEDLFGVLHRAGDPVMTVEEMDEAMGQALAEEDERIRAGR